MTAQDVAGKIAEFDDWYSRTYGDPDGNFAGVPSWLKDDLKIAWKAAIESQAQALSEAEANQQRIFDKYQSALKAGASEPPTEEGIAAAIRQTEYKYFGDYEFSGSQWDAVFCLVNAARHYLAAESRLAEAMRVIEPFADGSIDVSGASVIIGYPEAKAALEAARDFLNAKEKT